jgi:hypothetical protein
VSQLSIGGVGRAHAERCYLHAVPLSSIGSSMGLLGGRLLAMSLWSVGGCCLHAVVNRGISSAHRGVISMPCHAVDGASTRLVGGVVYISSIGASTGLVECCLHVVVNRGISKAHWGVLCILCHCRLFGINSSHKSLPACCVPVVNRGIKRVRGVVCLHSV